MMEKEVYKYVLLSLLFWSVVFSVKIDSDASTVSTVLHSYNTSVRSQRLPAYQMDMYVTCAAESEESLYYEVREFFDVTETELWDNGALLTNGIVAPGNAVGTVDQGGTYLVYNVNRNAVSIALRPFNASFGAVGGAVLDNREGDDLRSLGRRSQEMIEKINELNYLVEKAAQEIPQDMSQVTSQEAHQ